MSSKINARPQESTAHLTADLFFRPDVRNSLLVPDHQDNLFSPARNQFGLNETYALKTGFDFRALLQQRLRRSEVSIAQPRQHRPPVSAQMPRRLDESKYDGAFVGSQQRTFRLSDVSLNQIPPVLPAKGVTNSERILYVNGINTDLDGQASDMQEVANITGSAVVGIHNSTGGSFVDLLQCLDDKANVGNNLAVNSLVATITTELKAGRGRQLHIMAHSQGGLITARALYKVYHQLVRENRAQGLNRADAELATQRHLSQLKVETFGAASGSYPDGPRYVHYLNQGDMVPMRYGLGSDAIHNHRAGAGATVRMFKVTHPSSSLFTKYFSPHSITEVYLKFRVPFDQARHEGSRFMTAPVHTLTRKGLVVSNKD